MAEVKESLRALYLHNDPSSFQHLLGFTQPVDIFNEDEFKTGEVEVFDATEVHVNEEDRPDDSKDDLHERILNIKNINNTKATESEESSNYASENRFGIETLQCSLCELQCDTGGALKQHKLTFHRGEENFAEKSTPDLKAKKRIRESLHCVKCDKTFKHGGAFRRHKLIEHKENEEEVEKEWEALQQNFQWPCELCGKKFLDQHNMKVHKRKEHAVKRNEDLRESLHCVQCDQKFKYGRAFRQHKLIEHGENEAEVEKEWKTLQQNFQWPCKKCGKKFVNRQNVMLHKKMEHPVNRSMDEEERKIIRRDRERIKRKRRVVCEHCNKDVSVNALKEHIKAHKRKLFVPGQDFDCTLCGFGEGKYGYQYGLGKYRSEDALQRHVLKCHSGLVYKCEFCDFTARMPHAKARHVKRHHGAKTLQCDSCYKWFAVSSHLKAHIKSIHQKVKDKKCPHCGEAFQAGRGFTAHVNRHTNNRQFACETCGKSFLVHSHLKEHAKRHTLPYFCDNCELRFGSDTTLKDHRRIEHDQVPIKCRHGCGWTCWQKTSRNRHEKSCGLNPLPGAPYTVSAGTASSLTLQVNL